ncbi:uncharacterized protein TRUGW13939_00323 [Talaromyces rugulosus]|uniref:Uncharacterized protein n=1 Tax=Talaromyces rugulosus TaxID=121627 RepID=A0A7H8QH21_TALRU|nr:uncharacterized protein TRUGW13939_00323 [Talaromyces rugulosus]QKX53247.1 hypothetical protein TRUGW13939_00323 [Talaromyces rugulosus]
MSASRKNYWLSSFNETADFPPNVRKAMDTLINVMSSEVTAEGKMISLPNAELDMVEWVIQACQYVEYMRALGSYGRRVYTIFADDYNQPTALVEKPPIAQWLQEAGKELTLMKLLTYLGQVLLECENEIYLREHYYIGQLPKEPIERIRDKVSHVLGMDILEDFEEQKHRPLKLSKDVLSIVKAFEDAGQKIEDGIPEHQTLEEAEEYANQVIAQYRPE